MFDHQPKRHPNNPNWKLHYDPYYQGYPVQCGASNQSPLIQPFLDKIHHHISCLRSAQYGQARTFAVRFDLRFPYAQPLGDNERADVMHVFFYNLQRELNTLTRAHNLKYVWVREVGQKNGKTHFHVLLLLNDHAIHTLGTPQPSADGSYSDETLAHRIIRSWAYTLGYDPVFDFGSLIFFAKDESTGGFFARTLHRDDEPAWHDLFHRVSYLAKASTKPVLSGIRTFGTSQLPRF